MGEVSEAMAMATRIGYGSGEQVADGDWEEARELPPPELKRSMLLTPQQRLAALLAGRDVALACEDLALRARLDLDQGRGREAALQLSLAMDAAFAELEGWRASEAVATRLDKLHEHREPVVSAAAAALQGGLQPEQTEAVEAALQRLEATLRAQAGGAVSGTRRAGRRRRSSPSGSSRHEPALRRILLRAAREAGLPAADVSPLQGRLLELLARMQQAERILEVGTLGGYSTLWLARAAGRRVVTLEIDPHHAEVARANLDRAGVGDAVEIVVGPALETLPGVEGPFDLVFIDADKQSSADYLALALEKARPGALIVVDNVVRGGALADPDDDEPRVVGSRRVVEAIAAEPRLLATGLQTVGAKGWDGMLLALVRLGARSRRRGRARPPRRRSSRRPARAPARARGRARRRRRGPPPRRTRCRRGGGGARSAGRTGPRGPRGPAGRARGRSSSSSAA